MGIYDVTRDICAITLIERLSMDKDILYPVRVLHGCLHEWRKRLQFVRTNLLPIGKKCFILGTPTHSNIGDSAIVLAERQFLKHCLGDEQRIKELTVVEVMEYKEIVYHCIRYGGRNLVCWPGGGNLGDQWFHEEVIRRQAIEALGKNAMILFPQTIYYTPTERGMEEEQRSVLYYNGHPGLTVVAREQKSFEIMQALYPDTERLLTPDIVLSCKMENFGAVVQERKGVLFCVRSDVEKSVKDSIWEKLVEEVELLGVAYRKTDMYADVQVTKMNRGECVRQKMQEFCGAELVITDRLHGMVFAVLTGTPCIVFSNYNHKVKGTYDWIQYLPYVRYVESVDEAITLIPELIKMENCKFDNAPLRPYFDQLAEVVREKCPRYQ